MSNEGKSDSTLIRTNDAVIGTVVLVGNGAINNGWLPLRRALDAWLISDQTVPKVVTELRRQNTEAFHQLAILSYKFKIARAFLFKSWSESKRGEPDRESLKNTHDKKEFRPAISTLLQIRKNISGAFSAHASELTLRTCQEIEALIEPNSHFITTNWDNTLWREEKYKNLIHLHGRCEHPDSLVFPTELLVEDAAYDWHNIYDSADEATPRV